MTVVGDHYIFNGDTQMGTHYSEIVEDPTGEVAAALAKPTRAEQAIALAEVLQRIPQFSAHVRKLRQSVVDQMHSDEGKSWAEVGEAIHQHRTRAAQIARGVAGGNKKKAPPAEADGG